MKNVYKKPVLIDLSEPTGVGGPAGVDCVGGSGANGCGVGNVAGTFCNKGNGGVLKPL
ncbi:MAG: hypothetical protein WCP36_11435 [Methanomicrobiales archaeon]